MPKLLIPGDATALRANNFDALRLAMALLVVWSHSFALFLGSEENEPLSLLLGGAYNSGNIGVLAFFIISGFLITHSFLNSSGRHFMRRRITRIYPGYIVATTICAFVVVPLYSTHVGLSWSEVAKTLSLNLLLKNYFPHSDAFFNTHQPGAVNGSLWSIAYEFWCYIGVAVLGYLGLLRKGLVIAGLIAGGTLALIVSDLMGMTPGFPPFDAVFGWPYLWFKMLPAFALGMAVYHWRERIVRSYALLAALAVAAIASGHVSPHLAHVVVPLALTYAIFFVAFHPGIRLHGTARFGDFSYGTYLYAYPIQQMLQASWGGSLPFPVLIALSFVLSLVAGVLSWYLVERWFLKGKRHAKQKDPLAQESRLVVP